MKKLLFIALILTFSNTVFAKKTLNKYCDAKVNLAEAAYNDYHTDKFNIEEMLEVIDEQREKMIESGLDVPYFVYVEWQRIARDIVRHPYWSLKTIRGKTRMSCMQTGF